MGLTETTESPIVNTVPTAYLDTCLISGIARNDLQPREQDALRELLGLYERGTLRLLTTSVAHDEISRIPEEYRAPHEDVYSRLLNVPTVRVGGLTRPSSIGLPMANPNWRLWRGLNSLLTDDDAKHVFQAIKHRVTFFVTVDCQTILRHEMVLKERFRLNALSPSATLESLI